MNDKNQCKATTKSGKRCKLKAGPNGFCHIHDPKKIEERKETSPEEKRLKEVLDTFKYTSEAKGWFYRIKSIDRKNWLYATVSVSRSYRSSSVSGIFDISLDNGVRVSKSKTSFHGYGLSDLQNAVMVRLGELDWLKTYNKSTKNEKTKKFKQLEKLLSRFHIVARQLKRRYNSRETLLINDEYDVQDLLHALLKTIFDDVRPEEYSPSYAGGSSRIDFLIKNEKVVIEVKMASKSLRDNKIGEQLIVDINRYKVHPDCCKLICFIYDPNGNIRNPTGLESDLSGKHENIHVQVYVFPR